MAAVNTLESKNNKNDAKMHFTWSLPVLHLRSTCTVDMREALICGQVIIRGEMKHCEVS